MANSGKITTGLTPRLLQLGLDKIIEHFSNQLPSEVETVFETVQATKSFYELIELSGMGLAGRKGEGDVLTYDSINQEFNAHYPIFTYEKSARITMEAMEDNLYENMLERIGQELVKAHKYNKDYQGANILNNATTTTWMDGSALISTSHTLQAGGTNSNRLSPDLDLSADAVEQAMIGIYGFLNPDGLLGDYRARRLIVPTALNFVAERLTGSRYRPSTADNDINTIPSLGLLPEGYLVWRRLTSNTTWFIQTDASSGLMIAERKGIVTKTFNDNFTYDMIVTSHTRFRTLVGDHRCVIGSVGP